MSPGAVARRLGIAVTTLRTWHQRYGLGPSGHELGSHRRYDEADIRRLETMHRLTTQGIPAAEAARIALGTHPVDTDPTRSRAGGGHTIPVGRAQPAARGLAQAAMRLDSDAIGDLLRQSLQDSGVVATWNRLLVPVLTGVGVRQASTNRLIEVEHLLSRCIVEALARVPRPAGTKRVVLACADEEQHTLAMEALAAALAEAGIGCRLLGARTPSSALRDAISRTGPAAVAIWSQTSETGDPGQLDAVLTMPKRPAALIAAGPGWPSQLPDAIARPRGLTEALAAVASVA